MMFHAKPPPMLPGEWSLDVKFQPKTATHFGRFGPQDISRGYKAAMFRAEGDDEFSVKDDALEIVDYVDLHQLAI